MTVLCSFPHKTAGEDRKAKDGVIRHLFLILEICEDFSKADYPVYEVGFMKYKIGTVSSLLGISSEAIRLYERTGVIKTVRDEVSGYRFLGHLDITALFRARTYRQYGFSLNETEQLLNAETLTDIRKSMTLRREDLEKEICRKQLMLGYLDELRTVIDSIEEQENRCRIVTGPHLLLLPFMHNSELLLSKKESGLFETWADYTPFVFMSHRTDYKALLRGEQNMFTSLAIEKRYAELLEMPVKDEHISEIPSRRCVYTIVREDGFGHNEKKCLAHALEYIEENQLVVTGDPVTRTFIAHKVKDDYIRYREVWFPIAE